jgi:hypothetical protein
MHLLLFFAGRGGLDSRDSTGEVGGLVLLDGRLTHGAVARDGQWNHGTVMLNGYLTGMSADKYTVKYRGPSEKSTDVLPLGSFKLGERKLGG